MSATTTLTEVNAQIQKYWAPMFMKALRENLLLGALVNKEYQGEIKKLGDQVTVSQINDPAGSLRTVGVDADSFETELLSTTSVDIKADKRATAGFEFQDLVELQSQIGAEQSAIRDSLMFAVNKKINTYLYSLVNPSTSAPDHLINGVADFNAAQLNACRKLAAQAKWLEEKGWWALLDPSYMSDHLNAATMTSSDYVGNDAPVVGGKVASKRFGFNILEDNSAGLAALSSTGEDVALLFHPDFMHLVMQTEPTFKVSDLHSQKKYGYVISADVVFGAKLGINGNVKHIKVYNT